MTEYIDIALSDLVFLLGLASVLLLVVLCLNLLDLRKDKFVKQFVLKKSNTKWPFT